VKPVGIVGLGYVGGTIAEAFASAGVPTRGYDRYLEVGSAAELADCGVVFLCVPTPPGPDGGHDLAELWAAVDELAPVLEAGALLTIKSTVPPGTCDRLASEFPDLEFAMVPEFLVAARPLETFTHADRIVVGAATEAAGSTLQDLLQRVAPTAPVLRVRPIEAELIKLCSNAMLAVKVSFANELAEVCGRFGVAWERVLPGVGLDRRIGPDHLQVSAERGFGGACLPKDLDGLIAAARSAGYDAALLRAMAEFNVRIRRLALAEGNGSPGDVADRLEARGAGNA
jgi:UDPglucose 6-dehydrogenase